MVCQVSRKDAPYTYAGDVAPALDVYVHENEHRFLEELLDFLRIPSISTLPEHKKDVARAAQFVADSLKRAGPSNVGIMQNGAPAGLWRLASRTR